MTATRINRPVFIGAVLAAGLFLTVVAAALYSRSLPVGHPYGQIVERAAAADPSLFGGHGRKMLLGMMVAAWAVTLPLLRAAKGRN